jgi:hypothetical protein
MLKFVLIGVAAIVIIFVAVVATRPSAYHIERKLEINAPADVVFAMLNDLHQLVSILVIFGEPWGKNDPNMQATFDGPASGIGQSYVWSGKEAGKGKMTIAESVAAQKVGIKLEFAEPMESLATYTLNIAGTPTSSTVTWTMDGNHNFIGKAFGLFADMDGMLGGDIEKSLAALKSAAEKAQVAKPAVEETAQK